MQLIQLKKEDAFIKILCGLYLLIMLIVLAIANGTGDEGDSLTHYFYAKHAWQNKSFFFNHWAKPLFTLIAFPFAQLGFWGVELMNILLSTTAIWLTYKNAKLLAIPFAWMAPLCLLSMPMFNFLTLSGLTEPMFSCALALSIYLLLKEKFYAGIILFSFLPFIRSEGLLICGAALIYLIYLNKYALLPLIATGHIVYSILGYPVHKDFLWVFNTMTYATFNSAYGKGYWLYYMQKLPESVGLALTLFTFGGLAYGLVLLIQYFRKQLTSSNKQILFLIYTSFSIFFLMHTVFWALGIFNSGGILRIMIGIMPVLAIIQTLGLQYAIGFIQSKKIYTIVLYILMGLILLCPFTSHEFAYKWNRDFQLKADQQAQVAMKSWLIKNKPDYTQRSFYFEAPNISLVLDINWFDESKRKRLLGAFEKNEFKKGDLIVWEDWFAVEEGKISLSSLQQDTRLQQLASFEKVNFWGITRKTVLFEFK